MTVSGHCPSEADRVVSRGGAAVWNLAARRVLGVGHAGTAQGHVRVVRASGGELKVKYYSKSMTNAAVSPVVKQIMTAMSSVRPGRVHVWLESYPR